MKIIISDGKITSEIMSEIRKTKNANAEVENWAILPFDEAEDDARWEKLDGELEELLCKTVSTEKLTGVILMENDLSPFSYKKANTENDKATGGESVF